MVDGGERSITLDNFPEFDHRGGLFLLLMIGEKARKMQSPPGT
jgi:hypothetical protein